MSEPTKQQLYDVAWTLDQLTKVTKVLLEPVAAMDGLNAEKLEVTVQVTRDGEPLSPADARLILDWVESDEMQTDLRAWAETKVDS